MLPSSQQTKSQNITNSLLQLLNTNGFAWALILSFGFVTFAGTFVGLARLMNLFFPLGSLCVGLFLYFRFPILYVGFTWWLWILTPLIRRLVDYRSTFSDPSPILLAPLFVTLITGLTVLRYLPKMVRTEGVSFIMALGSIFFALGLGIINFPVRTVIIQFIEISVPITFGFHLFIHWQYYPLFRDNVKRVFLWAVIVMGLYGIFQFLVAPAWDTLWLTNAKYQSGGLPLPLKIRVWSTLNSAGPFAGVMMTGLLLLLDSASSKKIIAGVLGFLSFLLSLHRVSWITWAIGVLNIAGTSKPKKQMQLIIGIGLLGLIVLGLVSLDQFSDVIGGRITSLFNITEDGSSQARQSEYAEFLVPALSQIIGNGLGGLGHDSGILYLLLNFGWIATLLYMGGLLLPVAKMYQTPYAKSDNFIVVSRAIVLSLLMQMPTTIPIYHITGMIIWSFTSFGMAAEKYHNHQMYAAHSLNTMNQNTT